MSFCRLTICALLAPTAAMAAESSDQLADIVVTATRTPQEAAEILAPTIVISRDEIARSLSTDVAELLRLHAGVEISRPGGIGQSVSVFIRGANSGHTLVLLDGVRMNPGTIGTASLQNIPPEIVERIEIVKGPRSALYGSDAIGGVINIITRKTVQGTAAEAEAGYGSFATRRGSGLVGVGGDWGAVGANVAWLKSDGFPTRANSDIDTGYDNFTVGAHANAHAGPVELGARLYQAKGTADYLNSPTAFVTQDFLDRVVRFDAGAKINDLWHSQLVLSRMDNEIEQNQPVSFPAGEMDYLETHRNSVDWQNDLTLGDQHQLTAGAMYARENAHALSYGTFFDRDTDIVSGYVQHQFAEDAHALLLAVGYTDYSTFGGSTTWNAEYGYTFATQSKLIFALGKGFRAPTATDLYGFGGNPNLEPERARTYEISLRQPLGDSQLVSLSAFQNDIDELINFDSNTFTVVNIDRARIRGIEVSYDIHGAAWRFNLAALYQDPRNRSTDELLLRRAKHSASAAYSQRFGLLELGANFLYSGPRRDSQFPGFVELGSYVLANLTAKIDLGKQWSVLAQLDNVFNTQYQIANGYNTADRSGSVAVRWSLR